MAETTRKTKDTQSTAGAEQAQNQAAETQASIDTDPTEAGANEDLATTGVGEDAVLLKSDETVDESAFESAGESDELITLSKDVVQEFFYPNTKRPAYRILYTKGQTIRRSVIDAHNAGVEDRKRREAGEPDPENMAGIDSTTLASGTRSRAEDVKTNK